MSTSPRIPPLLRPLHLRRTTLLPLPLVAVFDDPVGNCPIEGHVHIGHMRVVL